MTKSYQYFQNRACEFFPCHNIEDKEDFNCLFCYCPLYLQENCLGTPEYILNDKGQRIKDCSNCMIPHRSENYKMIIESLGKKDQIQKINLFDIQERVWERMETSCSWAKMEKLEAQKHRVLAKQLIDKKSRSGKIHQKISILFQTFSKQCVQKGFFAFGEEKIKCNLLEKIALEDVKKGYLYSFHAPKIEIDDNNSVLEQFYAQAYQIAVLDVLRDWFHDYLERMNSVVCQHFVTPSFGPGYFGMQLDSVKELAQLMDLDKVGMGINQENVLTPFASIIGIHLVMKAQGSVSFQDCENCIGASEGCFVCKYGK